MAEDALVFDVTGPGGSGEPIITVASEDANGTQLDVQATLNAGIDPANSEPFIRAIVVAQLEETGMEVTEENIAAFMTLVAGQLEGMQMFSQSISTAITVTQAEDGAWQICSTLAPTASPAASTAPLTPVDPAASAPADPAASAPPRNARPVARSRGPGTLAAVGAALRDPLDARPPGRASRCVGPEDARVRARPAHADGRLEVADRGRGRRIQVEAHDRIGRRARTRLCRGHGVESAERAAAKPPGGHAIVR